MRTSGLGAAFALVLVATSPLAAAEVAILKSTDATGWRPAIDALRKAISTHSFSEYDLKGDRAEAERVLGGLGGRPVILVALGPLAAQTAKDVLPDAPLVYCMIQDPSRLALPPTASGVSFVTPVKNQLAAFRLVYPRGVRIGVIYGQESSGRLVEEAQKAAAIVRLAVVPRPVGSDKDVPQALRALLRGEDAVDALWIPPDPLLLGDETRRFLLAETLKAGKPVFSFSSALVAEGALVSNGPDLLSVGEQAADIVNRLAAGDRTARGVTLVPRAELVINKKIADKLKIEIPQDALRAANKVI
jgi:putative tryptophan/tyrosine transport system substrate-binding protein